MRQAVSIVLLISLAACVYAANPAPWPAVFTNKGYTAPSQVSLNKFSRRHVSLFSPSINRYLFRATA
jgi:hypothetical protein